MVDPPFPFQFVLTGSDETSRFAERVADLLAPGDVILLEGAVGAGKTSFARGVIQAVMRRDNLPVEDVPSPTFTLVQTYETADFDIWHADLYRLRNVEEVLELGLESAFDDSVCLIEWPERLGDAVPAGAAWLRFDVPDDATRTLALDDSPLGRRLADAAKRFQSASGTVGA